MFKDYEIKLKIYEKTIIDDEREIHICKSKILALYKYSIKCNIDIQN